MLFSIFILSQNKTQPDKKKAIFTFPGAITKIGHYYYVDTMISPDNFLAFEHSDGANFLLLNFMKRQKLLNSKNGKQHFSAILKAGAGIGIPKTRVQLFGETLYNRFHVAGCIVDLEAGLRYDSRYFFAEYTAKGAFANYTSILVIGRKSKSSFLDI